MSKFTVIEGSGRGPPDRHSDAARYHLEQAIIEILRSLVRGYDAGQRVSHHLTEFVRHLPETSTSLEAIIADALDELHREIDHGVKAGEIEGERESIVLTALQVAAETMATDPAAKGRLSSRQSRLDAAIEHQRISR